MGYGACCEDLTGCQPALPRRSRDQGMHVELYQHAAKACAPVQPCRQCFCNWPAGLAAQASPQDSMAAAA